MAQGTSGTSGRNPVQYLTIGRTLQILPATGYIQGMLEALTMLTTVEDGKRFKIKLEQFRQNLLLSGDYDATGNYKQAVKKTAV